MDINQALVAQEGNVTFWKKQLNSPMADMQAMALRQLSMANYSGLVELLRKSYHERHISLSVECITPISFELSDRGCRCIATAMNDSYELIRRYAVIR